MQEAISFIRAQDACFLVGLSAVCLFLLLYNISISRRLNRLVRARKNSRIADGHAEDIAQRLTEHSDALSGLDTRLEKLAAKQAELDSELDRCLKSVGIVRFNAFEDVGGEQSFALAVLDEQRNGVIVSGLYGRQDSRLYVKEIVSGKGERPLSDEELNALQKASS